MCVYLQVGVRHSGSTVSGCHCWALCVAWLSCSCWLGGRPSLPLALSSSFWDIHSTRSLVNSHTYSTARQTIMWYHTPSAVIFYSILTLLLFSVLSCKLGLLSAGELLQHCFKPVCRSQPCGGPCEELQVSDRITHLAYNVLLLWSKFRRWMLNENINFIVLKKTCILKDNLF